MAAGDFTDLKSRVQTRGAFNTADTGLTTTVIGTFINAALKQFASEHDWPWQEAEATITTVNGTRSYAVPTGWTRTLAIIDTTPGNGLDERSIEEIDALVVAARPTFFALYGDAVKLGPTPDAVYSLNHRYVKAETVLSGSTDVPLVPGAYDEAIVEWATMLSFRFTRQYDKAADAAARYAACLASVKDTIARVRRPRRTHTRALAGTLADLDDRLLVRGAFDPTSLEIGNTTRKAFINSALKKIAAERDWPWLQTSATITTIASTATYAAPATWQRTLAIIDTTQGNGLDERPVEELDSFIVNARPTFFALYGDSVVLAPVPDAVYSLKHRYIKMETVLAAATDVPAIPNAYDDGVVEWAAKLCFDALGDTENAKEAEARYAAWLAATGDTVDRTRHPARVHVRALAGTLADLDDRLLARGLVAVENPKIELGDTARKAFLNAALKRIANERDWPWLYTTATITTIAGTSTYALPAAYLRTDSIVEPTTGITLAERQIQELDRLTARGRPVLYGGYAGNIVIGPPPDGVYTLTHRYIQAETILAAKTDVPLMPNALDDGVVEYAAKLAFDALGDSARSKDAEARFNHWLKATYDNVRRGRRPLRVQVRPGAAW